MNDEDMMDDKFIEFEERAAIMEYDGGMSRAEAEEKAWEIVYGMKPKDNS